MGSGGITGDKEGWARRKGARMGGFFVHITP